MRMAAKVYHLHLWSKDGIGYLPGAAHATSTYLFGVGSIHLCPISLLLKINRTEPILVIGNCDNRFVLLR